jgi:hypothetical protein
MKFIHIFPILFALLVAWQPAQAQDKGFGAGIMLGEPSGINLKFWQSSATAIDVGVAWAFSDNGGFHIHGDYLWHEYDLVKISSGRMPVYYGVGARAKFGGVTRIGIRGVAGLAYMFDNAPVDIFVEIAPVFDLVEEAEFGVNGGVGVRYFF